MTMAQFAEQLPTMSAYVQTPVSDATGIEGAWDFTISFSPIQLTNLAASRGIDAPPQSSTTAAADPNGALTLFAAIEKQLGLKLEMQKRPMQVLVIDHMEQKPTDN